MFFIVISCGIGSENDWVETDLMTHGLPVKVHAPLNVKVEKSKFSNSEEYSLKGTDGYGMNVLVVDATSSNPEKVCLELKKHVQKAKYFDDFVENNPDGFIYKIAVDSAHVVYGFRKVRIQGNKQIVFQNQYMSRLKENEARRLYESIPD